MEINWLAELYDILASIGGLTGRWLAANKNRGCFVIWSVGATYWAIRDFNLGLYSQAFFCTGSLALNIYGYMKWKKQSQKIVDIHAQEKTDSQT